MAYLYVRQDGTEHRKHSYSAGNLFDQCPYAYFLQKVEGWKVKEKKARFLFGRAVEEAIQFHHEHNGEGAVNHFIEKWQEHAGDKELTYTKVEKDWATLYQTGVQMVKLYVIKQPELPIPLGGQTLFQKEFGKEVFPGDPNYGGIEDVGKLDIVAYVDPNHPLLPKVNWRPEYGPFRPIIVDIKTSGVEFPEQQGMAAFDVQLRRYSWHSGIRDVALLTLVKKSHAIQKGSLVTFLEPAGAFKAGQEAIVASTEEGENVVVLANESLIAEMERVQGRKEDGKLEQTKVAKARRDEWLAKFGAVVHTSFLTKQRLQFNAGFVTVESANDAGEIAGRQIVNIVNSRIRGVWENRFGVRYPNDSTSDPYFRAFVQKDEMYRNQNFTKTGDDFDDLFADYGGDDGE